jgi:hypothetical protein
MDPTYLDSDPEHCTDVWTGNNHRLRSSRCYLSWYGTGIQSIFQRKCSAQTGSNSE